jgi:hypothetical protein
MNEINTVVPQSRAAPYLDVFALCCATWSQRSSPVTNRGAIEGNIFQVLKLEKCDLFEPPVPVICNQQLQITSRA